MSIAKNFELTADEYKNVGQSAAKMCDMIEDFKESKAALAKSWEEHILSAFSRARLAPIEDKTVPIKAGRRKDIVEVRTRFLAAFASYSGRAHEEMGIDFETDDNGNPVNLDGISPDDLRAWHKENKGKYKGVVRTMDNELGKVFAKLGYAARHREVVPLDAKGIVEVCEKRSLDDPNVLADATALFCEENGRTLDPDNVVGVLHNVADDDMDVVSSWIIEDESRAAGMLEAIAAMHPELVAALLTPGTADTLEPAAA